MWIVYLLKVDLIGKDDIAKLECWSERSLIKLKSLVFLCDAEMLEPVDVDVAADGECAV